MRRPAAMTATAAAAVSTSKPGEAEKLANIPRPPCRRRPQPRPPTRWQWLAAVVKNIIQHVLIQ